MNNEARVFCGTCAGGEFHLEMYEDSLVIICPPCAEIKKIIKVPEE